jgi:hypothetical protein
MKEGLEQLYHQAKFTLMWASRPDSKGTDKLGVTSIGQAKNLTLFYHGMDMQPVITFHDGHRQHIGHLLSDIISGLRRHS